MAQAPAPHKLPPPPAPSPRAGGEAAFLRGYPLSPAYFAQCVCTPSGYPKRTGHPSGQDMIDYKNTNKS